MNDEEESETSADEIAGIEQAIEIGTDDLSSSTRNAVVSLSNGCAGTLIAADVVLTASHCGFDAREFADGQWHTLTSSLVVSFGPERGRPIHTVRANAVSTPPFVATPWQEDIALLRLAATVPASVAVPRPVFVDQPAGLIGGTIVQVGYGSAGRRRTMTGRDYRDSTMAAELIANGFDYTSNVRGDGIGERGTNIEFGDFGGPMLLGSATGFVLGELSHWAPYGIQTFGQGVTAYRCTTSCPAGSRPSIRDWIDEKVPQKADLNVQDITSVGCDTSGRQLIRVRVRNSGSKGAHALVSVFVDRSTSPSSGMRADLVASLLTSPVGTHEVVVPVRADAGSRRLDALADVLIAGTESVVVNNAAARTLTLPSCVASPQLSRLRYTWVSQPYEPNGARTGHTIRGIIVLKNGSRIESNVSLLGGVGIPGGSTMSATWDLPRLFRIADISKIGFSFEDGDCGACTGDDWYIQRVTVTGSGPSLAGQTVAEAEGIAFHMRGTWEGSVFP